MKVAYMDPKYGQLKRYVHKERITVSVTLSIDRWIGQYEMGHSKFTWYMLRWSEDDHPVSSCPLSLLASL